MDFENKTLLITGGTGTVGKALVKTLLEKHHNIGKLIVFSRDEQKHFEMNAEFSAYSNIEFVVGDVRDRDKLMMAFRGVDMVVHSAAMKHVPVSEGNPMEAVKTNVLGTQNVVDAAVVNNVARLVALSSDKAVSPINTYGASKLMLERLVLDADTHYKTKCTVVRFANVFDSKGSVVPFFQKHKAKGFLPITDPAMTRFSITMDESLALILFALEKGWGGEIILPISPSYRIVDVAEAVAPGMETQIVGARQGEKMHEVMVGTYESDTVVRADNKYVICRAGDSDMYEYYLDKVKATAVNQVFEYESSTNNEWLKVADIKQLISDKNSA